MTGAQHNELVDQAHATAASNGTIQESLNAAQQVLDLYSRTAWRTMISRAVLLVSLTALSCVFLHEAGRLLLRVVGGR